jgi:hypothetical protein
VASFRCNKIISRRQIFVIVILRGKGIHWILFWCENDIMNWC